MTDIQTALARVEIAEIELSRAEAALRRMERIYWTDRGYTVMPRRERLIAALREDAARPTPLEQYLEDTK